MVNWALTNPISNCYPYQSLGPSELSYKGWWLKSPPEDPRTSSEVIYGVYVNRCDWVFPICRLQLWWFLRPNRGTPGIITMSFAIFPTKLQKHWRSQCAHNFMPSIKLSNSKEHCFITSPLTSTIHSYTAREVAAKGWIQLLFFFLNDSFHCQNSSHSESLFYSYSS